MDISGKAIERSRELIPYSPIKWIESNILECDFISDINIWHDRAVFHFLMDKDDILNYINLAANSVIKDGYLILETFSETGPNKCSGLQITQYSESKFLRLFADKFDLIECFEEVHKTPFDTEQNFIWGIFKRK